MSAARSTSPWRWIAAGAALLVAFAIGWWLRGGDPAVPPAAERPATARPVTARWTCSMHPQIQLPEPGKCPICGMELVALSTPDASDERAMVFSETARKLAQIRTVPVERSLATVEVRMVGKIDYDETRTGYITAYVPGRLERLFVDYTGVRVNRGDHMVTIYSPELIAAQAELLQAIEAQKTLERSELEIMRRTAMQTVAAARERLRLSGLLPEQIAEIERRGTADEQITLYSPMTGVVIEKTARQGMYVETGSRIYTIADLERLWVRLEAYESDIEWVHLGQQVEFSTEAYPGTTFGGRVSFIDPVVDPRTRTVKLRVNVTNADRRLKPGMLVRAVVSSRIAGEGRVFDPYLAGKWISPMHPEIVKDRPGQCDVCGMDLVPAESLGFVGRPRAEEAPLVIPATAPLITGKRAVVYVEQPGVERPTYEGREVVLGPKAGDVYIVRSGLAEGERVVVEGSFKIDSALQIQARPSMMNPEGGAKASAHEHGASTSTGRPGPTAPPADGEAGRHVRELRPVYRAYLDLHRALAEDDPETARAALRRLLDSLDGVHGHGTGEEGRQRWSERRSVLGQAIETGLDAADLETVRRAFRDVSDELIALASTAGHDLGHPLVVMRCPMAFEGGADWLQTGESIENPYFGTAMHRCGTIVRAIEALRISQE